MNLSEEDRFQYLLQSVFYHNITMKVIYFNITNTIIC